MKSIVCKIYGHSLVRRRNKKNEDYCRNCGLSKSVIAMVGDHMFYSKPVDEGSGRAGVN